MTSRLGVESEEDWEENEEAAASFGGRSVVGRIISKQEVKERHFTSIFNRLWKGISEWEVKVFDEVGDSTYIGVTLKSREDARIVVEKQPWIFNGGVLLLEDWPDTGQWRDAKLDKMYCWVRMKGMPLKAFTKKNVTRLAEMAGTLAELRWINEQKMFLNGYVRARIGFPLQQSIFVGRYVPCGGQQHWVQFKFERLPLLSFKCGVWGHEQTDCNGETIMVRGENGLNVPKYGVWLKEEEAMPNCFVTSQQNRIYSSVGLAGCVDTEEVLTGGDSGRSVEKRPEMEMGPVPVEATTIAQEAVIGTVREGEFIADRGSDAHENRETVIRGEVMIHSEIGLRSESQYGLGDNGPGDLGFNSSLLDRREGAKCYQKRHVGADVLEKDENDIKKRKNVKDDSVEGNTRVRRGLDKGKQVVGAEVGCSSDGISGVDCGQLTMGSARTEGVTLGMAENVGNNDECQNRVGDNGEFIFHAEIGATKETLSTLPTG
ncbi:hypothetical protein F8388_023100 [Cannabis sativa]|uniref:Zinc knuckle CX2CX4HX4C domain-containing protein n=1 Tax=Cannabis sativa TaxID=3483 RepID=A0A7J6FMD1_CANSA|nr:hypothetical protein F8388_023100 [Cannabis sativa]